MPSATPTTRCRPAISSMSLGRCWVHTFPAKLAAAHAAGLEGIEIFYQDLEHLASTLPGGCTASTRLSAAAQIRELCAAAGLEIICLQPFMHSEGLVDASARSDKLAELDHWMALAATLGTGMIQMPASFLPREQLSDDLARIARDMREVADRGARHDPPMRFAMEALCFSTVVDTWEQTWEIVRMVDSSNFGLCLDTFNIGGRVYGDPAARSGMVEDAERVTRETVARLRKVDAGKIFFIQVVDAMKLDRPLVEGHELWDKDMTPRMAWSRSCRLFYGEQGRGAYLPVKDITQAIIDTGYDGWVSMEYFNRDMEDKGAEVPGGLAARAMAAWEKIVKDTGIAKE